jgi:hypothetical protein
LDDKVHTSANIEVADVMKKWELVAENESKLSAFSRGKLGTRSRTTSSIDLCDVERCAAAST